MEENKNMRINETNWLKNIKISHRGLHDEVSPENSMSAFKKAMDKGFAIEVDVYLTTDNQIVIFHDYNLKRMCGVNKLITKMSYEEMKDCTLGDSDEKIPLLKDLLDIATTPILIEFKSVDKKNMTIVEETLKLTDNFNGEFAMQSFNPCIILWLEKNRPEILRGQLSSFFTEEILPFIQKYVLKRMLFNRKSRPDFISYDERNLPNKYVNKYLKKHPDIVKVAWTVTSAEREAEVLKIADNVIFENYLPTSEKI